MKSDVHEKPSENTEFRDHRANGNLWPVLPNQLASMERKVERAFEKVLDAMGIEWTKDPNTYDTPRRWARMMMREVAAGRYEPRPNITTFPNTRALDEIYTVGPIAVRSMCSHHFCPVEGHAWCGIIPDRLLIGLSKFSRLARWVLARPQMQEEAVVQLADELELVLEPKGLAVIIMARHTCMTWRGVQEHNTTATTSVMRGLFRERPEAKAELLQLIAAQGLQCR